MNKWGPMSTIEILKKRGACQPSIDWISEQPDQSASALWRTCQRGDWMLWIAARVGLRRHEADYAIVGG